MRTVRYLAALGAAAAVSASAFAGGAGVEWGTTGNSDTNGAWTLGYEFIADVSTAVTMLGYYDDSGNGLAEAHEVGLWKADGTLLALAVVTSGNALIGHFRYADISDVVLTPGEHYVVGGASHTEPYAYFNDGFVVHPDITWAQDRYESGDPLAFPTQTVGFDGLGTNNGWFGGTIFLGEVPAPGALALLGLGGLVARRRRA